MKIIPCIIGVGYVGLPIILNLANKFTVYGFDKNRESGLNEQNEQYFTINSKNLYNLYEKGIIKSINFNKTIIDLYLKKKSKKYVECRNFIISRMEDSCNIDETPSLYDIPKAKSLLYDKQPEEESGGKSIKSSNKGGSPKDPKVDELRKKLNKRYYHLTEIKGLKQPHAIKKLVQEFPRWTYSTIESYIK